MTTEHDKLVEDMLHAYFVSPYPSGTRRAMRAALAIAVERCAALTKPHGDRPCDCERCYCCNINDAEAVARWDADNATYQAIRALLSPNDSATS